MLPESNAASKASSLQTKSRTVLIFYLRTLNGLWSSDGCEVLNNSSPETTICACNHLTNFAVLMQFKDEEEVGVIQCMNELVSS